MINWYRKEAWKHFYPEGNGKAKSGYVLHHVDNTLRHCNPNRYNKYLIKDLIVMPLRDHMILHNKGLSKSKDHCTHISLSLKGINNPSSRKVYCITTKESFDCMKYAAEKYHIPLSSICLCCKGKYKSAGKLPDGNKLRWQYI